MKKLKSFLRSKPLKKWLGILSLAAVSITGVVLQQEGGFLFTSTLNLPDHAAFDGTVYPIQQNADWSNLSSSEYGLDYDTLLARGKIVAQPACDEDVLDTPNSQLGWDDASKSIRNAKISCTVRYAGSYESAGNYISGDESADYLSGTHPAWDIKTPAGTPIHAIANGVVSKKAYGNGYGFYYVIQHKDVPSPSNPSQTTTLHSGYAHMIDEGLVNEGDVVTKGQVIGYVGTTGFSTTNHIHFQIDLDEAPWHLYWPFSSADYSAKGLSFMEAVNQGIGWDNMINYTTDSWKYVEAHLDGSTAPASTPIETPEAPEELDEPEEEIPEEEVVEEETVEEEVVVVEEEEELVPDSTTSANFSTLEIVGNELMMIETDKLYSIYVYDDEGELVEDLDFDGSIELTASDDSVLSFDKTRFKASDFEDGATYVELTATGTGEAEIVFEWSGREYPSKSIQVIDKIEPFDGFEIYVDGSFTPGQPETFKIQAVDMEGNPTPKIKGSGQIELEFKEGDGEFTIQDLNLKDLKNGSIELEFITEDAAPIKIGLTYGKKGAVSERLYAEVFTDIDEEHPFYEAVNYLYRKGDINGYPDMSFKPNNSVKRIEAIKIILEGLDQDLKANYNFKFTDAFYGNWYSDYLGTAVERGIIKGYADGTMKPLQGVNRVEFLKMLFSTAEDVEVDPVVTGKLYDDVDSLAWFAPYVQYAKENNLFPNVEDEFNPGQEVSRVEMVEVIYRFINVLKNDGEPYHSLMRPE